MAITQTVENKTPNGINMIVHKCGCGHKMQNFWPTCRRCGVEYWKIYPQLY